MPSETVRTLLAAEPSHPIIPRIVKDGSSVKRREGWMLRTILRTLGLHPAITTAMAVEQLVAQTPEAELRLLVRDLTDLATELGWALEEGISHD